MLYTHFTEKLFGLQGVKITNIEKEDMFANTVANALQKKTLFCLNITE